MYVNSFTDYVGPSNCVHYLVWSFNEILNTQSNLLQGCVFMGFIFYPHVTTHESNIGVQSRKVTE